MLLKYWNWQPIVLLTRPIRTCLTDFLCTLFRRLCVARNTTKKKNYFIGWDIRLVSHILCRNILQNFRQSSPTSFQVQLVGCVDLSSDLCCCYDDVSSAAHQQGTRRWSVPWMLITGLLQALRAPPPCCTKCNRPPIKIKYTSLLSYYSIWRCWFRDRTGIRPDKFQLQLAYAYPRVTLERPI